MINEIVDIIASNLVTDNDWLSEIRSIGYLNRINGITSVTDTMKEIGLNDREGNSGYIRFENDRNFSIRESPNQYSSCGKSIEITYLMTLVIAAKTAIPESVALMLAVQFKELNFDTEYPANNVIVYAISGGSNSQSVVPKESGSDQWNQNYRALYVDFSIQFTWDKNCNQIPITMACDNCTNILDLGCVDHCETHGIGVNATYTGTMTLKTIFNGVSVTQSFDVEYGEEIEIPLEYLNEDYEFNIQLFDIGGEIITKTVDAVEYDCFKIKILP